MRTFQAVAIALIAVFVSLPASAAHYADLYVIPVASHTAGQNGTMWMSDLAIQNFQTTPLDVQIIVIESGVGQQNVAPLMTSTNNGSVTVPAGGSVMLKDVLSGHRGMSSTIGAILVGADRPFAVTSRAYSSNPLGHTVGQTVTPAANFLDNTLAPISLATAVAYVPGLVQNGDFRTNLGMVVANGSGSGTALGVTITVRGANGAVLGTKTLSFAPGEITQLQFSAREIAAGNFDIGSAEVRIFSGSGSVVPYASIIDNRTADAVYVSGTFPQNVNVNALSKSAARTLFRSIFDSVSGAQQ